MTVAKKYWKKKSRFFESYVGICIPILIVYVQYVSKQNTIFIEIGLCPLVVCEAMGRFSPSRTGKKGKRKSLYKYDHSLVKPSVYRTGREILTSAKKKIGKQNNSLGFILYFHWHLHMEMCIPILRAG